MQLATQITTRGWRATRGMEEREQRQGSATERQDAEQERGEGKREEEALRGKSGRENMQQKQWQKQASRASHEERAEQRRDERGFHFPLSLSRLGFCLCFRQNISSRPRLPAPLSSCDKRHAASTADAAAAGCQQKCKARADQRREYWAERSDRRERERVKSGEEERRRKERHKNRKQESTQAEAEQLKSRTKAKQDKRSQDPKTRACTESVCVHVCGSKDSDLSASPTNFLSCFSLPCFYMLPSLSLSLFPCLSWPEQQQHVCLSAALPPSLFFSLPLTVSVLQSKPTDHAIENRHASQHSVTIVAAAVAQAVSAIGTREERERAHVVLIFSSSITCSRIGPRNSIRSVPASFAFPISPSFVCHRKHTKAREVCACLPATLSVTESACTHCCLPHYTQTAARVQRVKEWQSKSNEVWW